MKPIYFGAFCALLAQISVPGHAAGKPVVERLAKTVVPLHYDLHVHPNADKLSFSGEVRIDVRVNAPVPAVILNAKELVFDDVKVDGGRSAVVTLDAELERANLQFTGGVSPGEHSLL